MPQPTSAAMETAQRLWAREGVDHGSPEIVAAVVERVCVQLSLGIARWIGVQGYRNLLERALAETRTEHAALGNLHCRGDANDATVEAVRAHGAARVKNAFLALVARLIDLLGRVVGAEMAARLVEQSWAAPSSRRSETKAEGVG
jgi:hypothetical protein